MRKAVNHHGERAGVFCAGIRSSSNLKGGNSMVFGRGGVTRSKSHNTGNISAATSSSGCKTTIDDKADMP